MMGTFLVVISLLGAVGGWSIHEKNSTQAMTGERLVEKFHRGNVRVALRWNLNSPLDEPTWKLNFRLKEGVGIRVRLVQGRFSDDHVFLAAIDDEKEGEEVEMDIHPVRGPRPGGWEDLIVLVQDGQGRWEKKEFPSRYFNLRR